MAYSKKYMFLIHDDKVFFLDYSVFLLHKEWAKSLGIDEYEFYYTIRGTCTKIDGKWIANFYCENDQEDGRCAAAAHKFAPEIMKHCKANSLEILSDEEPFTIKKNTNTNIKKKINTKKKTKK